MNQTRNQLRAQVNRIFGKEDERINTYTIQTGNFECTFKANKPDAFLKKLMLTYPKGAKIERNV